MVLINIIKSTFINYADHTNLVFLFIKLHWCPSIFNIRAIRLSDFKNNMNIHQKNISRRMISFFPQENLKEDTKYKFRKKRTNQ